MASTIQINCDLFETTIESVVYISPTDDGIDAFMHRLHALEGDPGLVIDTLDFKVKAAGVAPQGPYRYEIAFLDGRHWKQEMLYQSRDDGNPSVAFDIAPPGFLVSVFGSTIPLRQSVENLHRMGVDKIRVVRA
jgi:hypothetical protein